MINLVTDLYRFYTKEYAHVRYFPSLYSTGSNETFPKLSSKLGKKLLPHHEGNNPFDDIAAFLAERQVKKLHFRYGMPRAKKTMGKSDFIKGGN